MSDCSIRTTSKFIDVLIKAVSEYNIIAIDSIARNDHMNKLAGKKLSRKVINNSLYKYLIYCALHIEKIKGKFTVFDALNILTYQAKAMSKSRQLKNESERAVIVDFINFIAAAWWQVDYGLYTRDLNE